MLAVLLQSTRNWCWSMGQWQAESGAEDDSSWALIAAQSILTWSCHVTATVMKEARTLCAR